MGDRWESYWCEKKKSNLAIGRDVTYQARYELELIKCLSRETRTKRLSFKRPIVQSPQ
jgi:hypothetical protein